MTGVPTVRGGEDTPTSKERGSAMLSSEQTSSAPADTSVNTGSKRPSRRPRRKQIVVLGIAVALFAGLYAYPFTGANDSIVLTMSTIFMWIILSTSWNLISGFAGYVDFGHAVHFGIGGYVAGILMVKQDLGFLATLPVVVLVCGLFAAVIGYPLLRLRGVYFSIAMLGAFLAIREIALIATPLTGGARGLVLPPMVNRVWFYYVFLVGAAIMVAAAFWIRRSQYGGALLAIRDDEDGAEARGISTTALKLFTFVLAACITGTVGAFWAYQATFIDPEIMFRDDFLIAVALMATLGGLGTAWGPPVGAVIYLVIQDYVWANDTSNSFLVVFGALLIVLVLVMPEGIAGTVERGDRTVLGRKIQQFKARRTRDESTTEGAR
ncbi:branched-chain amino acid ABC transporter permease [Aeromicrobium duanguangcaii]|uniref:Branched-chain amino acid ABC transporter permease n=1 Tax=Aeromicrobium duanguangcaii TaxID=2968086 RepID=A0ABY5KEL7_9ACTN|nr:branched-chain amino acid ABC transporter permease [Aeromicrobium duanguangcaii]MCD9155071.1 branched-chain amino acid ABC transporter permease [Aeromicrobium duanguangcaii]UUI68274.1 branched-chain amino acid ABC transporter permease [Aeromicrobium duanguangcaii]